MLLSISDKTMEALEVFAAPAFEWRLERELSDEYPSFLPMYPPDLRLPIVSNMVARARNWDLRTQDAIANFAELMIAISADFDEEPEVARVLTEHRNALDQNLLLAIESVSERAWEAAANRAARLPFYLGVEAIGESLDARTRAAARFLFPDELSARLSELVRRSLSLSQRLGFANNDAPIVLTACKLAWGDDFLEDGYPTESDRFDFRASVDPLSELRTKLLHQANLAV